MEAYEESDFNEDDASVESSDDEQQQPARPSETRLIRELGQGIAPLVTDRPAPTRHDPPPKLAEKIQKVNSLYNYGLIKAIPAQDIESHKKQKRVELEVVPAEAIAVLLLFL